MCFIRLFTCIDETLLKNRHYCCSLLRIISCHCSHCCLFFYPSSAEETYRRTALGSSSTNRNETHGVVRCSAALWHVSTLQRFLRVFYELSETWNIRLINLCNKEDYIFFILIFIYIIKELLLNSVVAVLAPRSAIWVQTVFILFL
jgi:hypothetical protein